jgi:predicted DCC family thiol-disulfide oxidoreductase YuxK
MQQNHGIILFDGVCNLCTAWVQFIIPRDKAGYFRFASLQSPFAQNLLRTQFQMESNLETVIFVENGKCYTESAAALLILMRLGGPWVFCKAFFIIPKGIRNAVYRFIARNRYKWFGEKQSCWLPNAALNSRFLG